MQGECLLVQREGSCVCFSSIYSETGEGEGGCMMINISNWDYLSQYVVYGGCHNDNDNHSDNGDQ